MANPGASGNWAGFGPGLFNHTYFAPNNYSGAQCQTAFGFGVNPNDLLIVAVNNTAQPGGTGLQTVASVICAGLSFTRLGGPYQVSSAYFGTSPYPTPSPRLCSLEIWYAVAPSAFLASDFVTVTMSANIQGVSVGIMAIDSSNTAAPFSGGLVAVEDQGFGTVPWNASVPNSSAFYVRVTMQNLSVDYGQIPAPSGSYQWFTGFVGHGLDQSVSIPAYVALTTMVANYSPMNLTPDSFFPPHPAIVTPSNFSAGANVSNGEILVSFTVSGIVDAPPTSVSIVSHSTLNWTRPWSE